MTRQRDLKRLIRERMTATGERYTTARAHLVASERAGVHGGTHPDIAPTTNLLASKGLTGPGAPLDEDLVFGLSGGIGFLYGAFRWVTGPTFTIVPRLHSMPDPQIAGVVERTGGSLTVRESGGAKTAGRHLDEALDRTGRALITVGAALLPHLGLDGDEASSLPRVVGVEAADGSDLAIDDLAPDPIVLDRATVDRARSAVPKSKHRLVEASSDLGLDWPQAMRQAIRSTVAGFDTPPARPFASNVGLAGLGKWRDMLRAESGERAWRTMYGSDRDAFVGLTRTWQGIMTDYTAPAASRPSYARFLRVAAGVVEDQAIAGAAGHIERSADSWRAIVDLVEDSDPQVADAVGVLDSIAEAIASGADGGEVAFLRGELDALGDGVELSPGRMAAVYGAISDRVDEIVSEERAALRLLAST